MLAMSKHVLSGSSRRQRLRYHGYVSLSYPIKAPTFLTMVMLAAGNLFVRYAIAAVGTAVCIPMIDTIGVGWMNSISALFIALSTISMACVVYLGIGKTDA